MFNIRSRHSESGAVSTKLLIAVIAPVLAVAAIVIPVSISQAQMDAQASKQVETEPQYTSTYVPLNRFAAAASVNTTTIETIVKQQYALMKQRHQAGDVKFTTAFSTGQNDGTGIITGQAVYDGANYRATAFGYYCSGYNGYDFGCKWM